MTDNYHTLGKRAARTDNQSKGALHVEHFLERAAMNKRQAEERKAAGLTKLYATKEQCARAMKTTLDKCGRGESPTAKAVFRLVGIPENKLKEVLAHPDYHHKDSVKANQYHPVIKQIKECKESTMTKGKTVGQSIGNIKKAHNIAVRVANLELRMDKLESLVHELSDTSMSAKDIALTMKLAGKTQKEIAEYTGKGIATIKRWWPTLIQLDLIIR